MGAKGGPEVQCASRPPPWALGSILSEAHDDVPSG